MRSLAFGRFGLPLGQTPHMVGILNLTPDSFSDGGEYASFEAAALRWKTMEEEGAAVIDIGAESTRPGSVPVSAAEEIRRLSAVKELIAASSVPVSVDTYKSETAAVVLNWGAQMLNDVSGFQADQQGVMEEKALQAGLLTQAQDQAEAAVTGLLTPLLDEGQALEVRTAEAET